MFDLYTVILLFLLGFTIYYLLKTEKTCYSKFLENKQSEQVVGVDAFDNTGLPVSTNNGVPVSLEKDNSTTLSTLATVPTYLNAPNASNTVPTSLSDTTSGVITANDTYEGGADIMSAFQQPVQPPKTPDTVNINPNNQKYDAKDFLPKEINDQWFDTDFSQAKFNLADDKLINTDRYVIGINTVGQSLKNASYDIRGTVPNPKYTISPWNNSTYEPDFNIKPLC